METLMEDEEYEWREVKLPSLIPLVPEPELERETGERRRGRDILISVDHGPNSKHAFDWALVHLCRLADTIHLVHAVASKTNPPFISIRHTCMYMCLFVLFQFQLCIGKCYDKHGTWDGGWIMCRKVYWRIHHTCM